MHAACLAPRGCLSCGANALSARTNASEDGDGCTRLVEPAAAEPPQGQPTGVAAHGVEQLDQATAGDREPLLRVCPNAPVHARSVAT